MTASKRKFTGSPVNPLIPEPARPGSWVNSEKCTCGATYEEYRGGMSFVEAANVLRTRAKTEGDEGGGYRTRGPVLWVMRANKLGQWYAEHAMCGQMKEEAERLEKARCPWCEVLCDSCHPDRKSPEG